MIIGVWDIILRIGGLWGEKNKICQSVWACGSCLGIHGCGFEEMDGSQNEWFFSSKILLRSPKSMVVYSSKS